MSDEDILKQRAEKLSKKSAFLNQSNEGEIEVVKFILGNEEYAIESIYIREVYLYKDLISLPCVPSFVAGIINIRRKIISVINLKSIFELSETEKTGQSKILVLQKSGYEFGIIVDSVVGVSRIYLNELQGALPTMTGIRQELLKGITNHRLIVLDGEKLLTHQSLSVNENVS